MHRIALVGLIVATVLFPCAASAKIEQAFGIDIQSCTANSNNNLTNGINVVYYNTHPSPATEVDFLIRYHGHDYTFVDHGTFTQNAQINHNLTGSFVGYPWHGPQLKICTVTRVVLENGKVLE